VLPEFQGLSLGPMLSDAVAQHFLDEGLRYFSVTAHPSLGERRQRSKRWRPSIGNMVASFQKSWKSEERDDSQEQSSLKKARTCYRHQYMGPDGHGNDHLLPEKCKRRRLEETPTSCAECALALRVATYVHERGGSIMPSALCAAFANESVGLPFLERHLMVISLVPEAMRKRIEEDSSVTPTYANQHQNGEGSIKQQGLSTDSATARCLECSVASLLEAHLRGTDGSSKLASLAAKFTLSTLQKAIPNATFGVDKAFLQRHFHVHDGQVTLRNASVPCASSTDIGVAYQPAASTCSKAEGAKEHTVPRVVHQEFNHDGQVTLGNACAPCASSKENGVATPDQPAAIICAKAEDVKERTDNQDLHQKFNKASFLEAARERGTCSQCFAVAGILKLMDSNGGKVRRAQVAKAYGPERADVSFLRKHFISTAAGYWSVQEGSARIPCDECALAVNVAECLHKRAGKMSLLSVCNSKFDGRRPDKTFLARWFCVQRQDRQQLVRLS